MCVSPLVRPRICRNEGARRGPAAPSATPFRHQARLIARLRAHAELARKRGCGEGRGIGPEGGQAHLSRNGPSPGMTALLCRLPRHGRPWAGRSRSHRSRERRIPGPGPGMTRALWGSLFEALRAGRLVPVSTCRSPSGMRTARPLRTAATARRPSQGRRPLLDVLREDHRAPNSRPRLDDQDIVHAARA